MAQKVNSTSLRTKKRLNWNNQFCVHDFNDHFNMVNNISDILVTNNKINSGFKNNLNFANILKNSKSYTTNYEYFDERFFFHFVKFICTQRYTIQNFHNYKLEHFNFMKSILKIFLQNQHQLTQRVSNSQVQKKT
jgi:hypothetical protein